MSGLGTMANVAAVVVGSLIGMVVKGGLKQRFQDTLMQVLGLATMFIGASGALKGIFVVEGSSLSTTNTMMLIISLVVGAILGELLRIEDRLDNMGVWLKEKTKQKGDNRFVEGFVTSSLVICVGAMAIVGSLEDGLHQDASMLYAKSMLDFMIVMIFASTLGIGVLFSAIPLGIYQGTITLSATAIAPCLSDARIANLSFVGSVLIFGVGVNIAFGKKFKVGNMLPAVLIAFFFG